MAEGTSISRRAEYSVTGMHCGSCAALIEETLVDEPGVTAASVSWEAGRAVVHFDPSVTTVDRLAASITDTGYPAALAGS